MATTQTLYLHNLQRISQGNYRVTDSGIYTYNAEENGGPGDDQFQLGDIGDDHFLLTNGVYNNADLDFVYRSALPLNSGFVAVYYDTGDFFVLSYNNTYGTGDTFTTIDTPFAVQCFTTGTQIATTLGPVAIEDLCVGDTAVTAFGTRRSINWIGSRMIDCSGENAHMAPVRVRANAFGGGVPERGVLLSPGHPVLVHQNGVEVLVPIMNLINGTTIERTSMPSVTYWHIELDKHDVLLADGLPAESFFDMGSRGWFDHDLDDILANPDLVPAGQHGRCREVAIDGPLVEAERRRLADLFYADLSAQCVWPSAGEYAVQ
mgnify:CR=1 FL=1